MLLAIDVGNTTLHFGLYPEIGPPGAEPGGPPLHSWRVSTDRERTADEHAALFQGLLGMAGYSLQQVSGCAVCSVVPPLAPALRQFARRYLRCAAGFVGEALQPRLPVRYTPPTAVGADRLVDAVAVLRRYGAPAVVADFGTATTFDAISRDGEYLGGAIAPGIGISLEALFRTAAHLPRIELARPARAIGGSTVESMQSGAFYGFVGQVEGIVARFRAELGPGTTVVATGGLAEQIAAEAACIDHVDPNLTLDGLRAVWLEWRHATAPAGAPPSLP
jgi:type III pantothenate kinase